MVERPPIPRPIRRDVLVEAGHRCAIPTCRSHPVEVHHSEDWAKVQKHEPDNLIALCPNCHARVTKGEIDVLAMKAYKANLGLLRDRYSDLETKGPSGLSHSCLGSGCVGERVQ